MGLLIALGWTVVLNNQSKVHSTLLIISMVRVGVSEIGEYAES